MKPLVLLLALLPFLAAQTTPTRPRVIVLTDITNEPDDEESMVRFLVYANEYDVEGLIATTSVWLRDKVAPNKILERVDAYAQVQANLARHAPGYPTAAQLRQVIRSGRPEFGMRGVGAGKQSEGSQLIIAAATRPDPRPLHISVWGGANTLAQALFDAKNTLPPAELDALVAKLRVYSISDQDDSGKWIRDNFPKLSYTVSPSSVSNEEYYRATWTGISGDRFYRNAPGHRWELVTNEWLEAHIRSHGPLGALYPPWKYIMEGDTPSFLGLINNGLGSHHSPAYGGWGGRYVLVQSYGDTRPIWTSVREARDTVIADDGRAYTSEQATIWRWREAYQHDFAARMDWSITDSYQKANHNPTAVLNGDKSREVIERQVSAGDLVELSAEGSSDPDGNQLSYHWFHYNEAEARRDPTPILIDNDRQPKASLKVAGPSGRRIHIILEVKDNGSPALYAYRRLILTVRPQ